MTTSTTTPAATAPVARPKSRRRVVRAASVLGAGVLNAGVFVVARAAGTDFTITDPGPGKLPHTFVLPEIVIASIVFGLLGWASLALFERCTSRPVGNWATLAVIVVLLSFVPIAIEVATLDTKIMLGVVHTAVLVALIPMLRRR